MDESECSGRSEALPKRPFIVYIGDLRAYVSVCGRDAREAYDKLRIGRGRGGLVMLAPDGVELHRHYKSGGCQMDFSALSTKSAAVLQRAWTTQVQRGLEPERF